MQLDTLLKVMRREAHSPEAGQVFEEARTRQPALSTFCDVHAVLAFLNKAHPSGADERSAVTCALLDELQSQRSQCWTSILIEAFRPGLIRLWCSASTVGSMTDEDVDWLIIESFIDAAHRLPLATQGQYAVANLMQNTRKLVMQHIKHESRRAQSEVPWIDPRDVIRPPVFPSPEQFFIARERARQRTPEYVNDWLRRLCADTGEDLQLLEGPRASAQTFIDWVKDQHPHLNADDLARTYRRLGRRRRRLLVRLRRHLSERQLSDPEFGPALLVESAQCSLEGVRR